MTKTQAIMNAKAQGGAYIQMLGCGDYARWVVLGKNYPGHSNYVFFVSRSGQVERCR